MKQRRAKSEQSVHSVGENLPGLTKQPPIIWWALGSTVHLLLSLQTALWLLSD